MEIYKDKNKCYGCGACKNICPKKAITLKLNNNGFYYPTIDKEKCIRCGLCKKVCPIEGKAEVKNNQEFYALKNKDNHVRENSSSGGFFSVISKYIIDNGGYVFGVIFDEDFKAIHYGTNNIYEIEKFRGSKYVQSETLNTYNEVKDLLKKGKLVLYTGTPCQIAGLKKFLSNKEYENLITIDNICHGVPSPKIFEQHKQYLENKFSSKITGINFRYKTKNRTQNIKVKFQNGREYFKTNADDKYYQLFQSDFILRNSCYTCEFASINRVADITIGDFWDFNNFLGDFDDRKGVSLVILNNKKAKEVFNNVSKSFYIKQATFKESFQPNLKEPTKKNEKYEEFWRDYYKKGYLYAIKKYPQLPLKIKIKKIIKKIIIFLRLYSEE